MKSVKNGRLWFLRTLSIFLMCASVYIAWYTISSGKPRDFWKEKLNPQRGQITAIPGEFEDQAGNHVTLKNFEGKNIVATFVFKDCNISCPLIMTDLKYFDSENPNFRKDGVFLIFTFDDHQGKSAELQAFLNKYRVEGDHWRVLTSDARTIRTLANTFELQYKKQQDGKYIYMHSNFYAIADKTGKVKRELRGIETNKSKFVEEINNAL